jgi:hypothetical protein
MYKWEGSCGAKCVYAACSLNSIYGHENSIPGMTPKYLKNTIRISMKPPNLDYKLFRTFFPS